MLFIGSCTILLGIATLAIALLPNRNQKLLESKKSFIDPIVEHLIIGFNNGLWEKKSNSWLHSKTGQQFTVVETSHMGFNYEPMIYILKDGKKDSVEVVHVFSESELKIVLSAIKNKHLENMIDANIGSELN